MLRTKLMINEELTKINQKIRNLAEKREKFNSEIDSKFDELNKIKTELQFSRLKEIELLRNSEWRIFVKSSIYLVPEKNKSVFVFQIRDLFEASWHTTIELSDELSITLDDNDIAIRSNNLNTIIQFIKFYELKVNTKLIDEEIEKMKELISIKVELTNELSLQLV